MKLTNKIKVGLIGGAGYTGGELIRLLLHHPDVNLSFVQSKSNAAKYIYEVHKDLLGTCNLKFSNTIEENIDVLFLCNGHGESLAFLNRTTLPASIKIIDLSQDFRPGQTVAVKQEFIYGLTESNKEQIKKANYIANPGCFATCIQLALLPLAKAGLLQTPIHINATTGSTGAGQSLSESNHFSWRNNNLSVYKAFEHQHLKEINAHLSQQHPANKMDVSFVPQRGNFTRGILASIYTNCSLEFQEINTLYLNHFKESPFVHIAPFPVDLKQVVNTNNCFLQLEKYKDKLFITAVIDNLLKGAVGQALQNMNLIFGRPENTGLTLKSSYF